LITCTKGPSLIQLLSPSGVLTITPAIDLDISPQEIVGLYADMVTVRQLDAEAVALARQGELALWPPLRGQEAAQIGSARALGDHDMAFLSYRELGVAYCRGIPLIKPIGLFRGLHHGWAATEPGVFPYAIVVGSHGLHAVGFAMGIQRDGVLGTPRAGASIAYFGDGATSQGDISEALVFAGSFGAAAVFFCQNNQWAISQPVTRQTPVPLYRRAEGFGVASVQVDGNDVIACLAVTRQALATARAGGGPTFIEACTYRMDGHTTTDDPGRYRTAADVDAWQDKDPISRVRAYLLAVGAVTEHDLDQVALMAHDQAADLRRQCLELPDPEPAAIFENVYAEDHPLLAEQRAELLACLDQEVSR
jgi:2-oxoisovalerate dehydrogenase E1 component alpha subunit